MTDTPERLRDDELPPGLGDALREARGDVPSEAEVAALERRVLAAIAGGAGGGGGPAGKVAAKAAADAAAAGTPVAGSGILAATLGGVVVLGIAWWNYDLGQPRIEREREAREAVEARIDDEEDAGREADTAPEPEGGAEVEVDVEVEGAGEGAAEVEREGEREVESEVEAEVEAEVESEVEAEVESEVEGEPGIEPEPEVVVGPPPLDELAILRTAQRLLRSDPAAALAEVERLRDVPAPAWAEERERVAIEALARLGRTDEARARLDRFVSEHPRSAYRPRLEELLERTPE